MNAEQFIEFANDFAKASAKTSSNEIQQAYEDNLDCLARPGEQVVVIRKPWPIGRWGTVISFSEHSPCYFRVEVEIDGKRLHIPAHSLARWVRTLHSPCPYPCYDFGLCASRGFWELHLRKQVSYPFFRLNADPSAISFNVLS